MKRIIIMLLFLLAVVIGAVAVLSFSNIFIRGIPESAEPEGTQAPPEKRVFPRKKISTYLGIWMPAILHPGMHSMVERKSLVAIGANTVALGIEVGYLGNGEFDGKRLEYSKRRARQLIRYYKEADLAVIISIVPVPANLRGEPGPIPEEIRERVLRNYERVAVGLARISEEENVEVFCPMDEPDFKLGAKLGSSWGQEILPKIRSVFSGKVLWKGSLSRSFERDERIDFSGYDIVGLTVFPWAGLGHYAEDVGFYINTLKQWSAEDGVDETIVAEFGNYARTPLNKDEELEAIRIVFEQGMEKVDGFILLDPPRGFGTPIRGSRLEGAIRTWFERLRGNME
jgi:hypothetical protein